MKYFVIVLLLAGNTAFGQSADDHWTLNMYLENDLFGETDQHYTNGIRFSWISPDLTSYEDDPLLPKWVREANSKLRFFHGMKDGLERNLVISLGQLMFTPSDKKTRTLIEDDRPYAGYLYLGFAYHTRDEEQLDTIELNIGMVGPASLAQEAQNFIHKERDIEIAEGWGCLVARAPVSGGVHTVEGIDETVAISVYGYGEFASYRYSSPHGVEIIPW